MSNPPRKPSAAANEKLLQYVERALRSNPLEQSAAIIRRRNRLLGLEPAAAAPAASAKAATSSAPAAAKRAPAPASALPAVDPAVHRQNLLRRIEPLRANFWTMELVSLRQQIDALDAGDFPDIEAVVRRLATVAKYRDQIPRILTSKAFDPDFFKIFKEVLIASPRDSAIVKERALVAFGDRKLRNRGTKMIKLIEKELPHYYHLEAQWLKSLVAQRGTVSAPAKTQDHFVESSGGGFFSGIPWWGYMVIFGLIRGLIRLASGE